MGWFSRACSWVGDKVSSAASAVKNVASKTYEKAREVCGKAIGWMAEKAEGFVDNVKSVWKAVKPYVDKVRAGLLVAAAAVPHPWIKAALIGIEKGLGALTAFENSPIAKKVEEAIKWSIELAKRWQRRDEKVQQETQQEGRTVQEETLSEAELEVARRHQENMRFAEREIVAPEQRHQMELAGAINDYEIARADLAKVLQGEPENFEHYLRLRATQKLLTMADKKFRHAQSIDELSSDDLFLVRIASDLVKANPELSEQAAVRLDRVLSEKYGKKLTPFVFEEMIASWGIRAHELGAQWDADNRLLAKDTMLLKRLQQALKIQAELSEDEVQLLAKLEVEVPANRAKLDALATSKRDIQRYVGAAEGFLQLLEKSQEQIEAEDREYLIEDGSNVGRLLMQCAESNKPFSELTEDEQALVIDYANIFQKESQARMAQVLEVSL